MSDNAIHDQIQSEINSHDVVLFMKGTPVFPQCGFSADCRCAVAYGCSV